MFEQSALSRMTPEQRKRVSLLGVQARELKRLSQEPRIYSPIPEGLQLAALFLDFRCAQPMATHVLLFEAGRKNRYATGRYSGPGDAASTKLLLINNYLAFYAARQNCPIWAAFGPYGQHSGQHFHALSTSSTCAISHP